MRSRKRCRYSAGSNISALPRRPDHDAEPRHCRAGGRGLFALGGFPLELAPLDLVPDPAEALEDLADDLVQVPTRPLARARGPKGRRPGSESFESSDDDEDQAW